MTAPTADPGAGADRPVRWHLLTGEYPPQPGGVSDYTALVAAALAGAGREVHVWCPAADGPTPDLPGVAVHREAGRWTRRDLEALGRALDAMPGPRRLLVQYAPKAWGYRGNNLGFGRWLARRPARGDEVWTMVHEPFYPWRLRDRPRRLAMAAINRLMIRDVIRASAQLFVATPQLEGWLRPYERGGRRPMTWLPVPSNIPTADAPGEVAALRRRLAPGGAAIVGVFGSYGAALGRALARALPPLLAGRPDRVGLLLGQDGPEFAAALAARHPALAGRLLAPGWLDPRATSLHLQACDLMMQPYEDGVSTRRGTIMAVLAHGRPAVTNLGPNSEPFWAGSGAVAAVATAAEMPGAVEALLADPAARARLGGAARALYDGRFAVARAVAALLGAGAGAGAEAAGPVSSPALRAGPG